MLSRVIPTISLISCWVIAMMRPSGASLFLSLRRSSALARRPGKILKDDLLDLIAGPAQPPAQQLDKLHRDRRLAAHEGNEFAPVNGEQLAIAVGRGVGRPRLPVEQRDFTENLAGADQVQDRIAAIGRGDADFYRAADDGDQAHARVSLGEDRGSPLQRGVLGVAAKLLERLGFEIGEISDACAGPTICCSKTTAARPACL